MNGATGVSDMDGESRGSDNRAGCEGIKNEKAPLSVLVPVKNEADLHACLTTVAFADEVVVIDSASSDGTVEVATEADARVVQFDWNRKFPRKKNWALENVPWRNEWVLIIDADERITPALEGEIRAAIQRDDVDGFYLNRRFWFLEAGTIYGVWLWIGELRGDTIVGHFVSDAPSGGLYDPARPPPDPFEASFTDFEATFVLKRQ